MGGGEGGRREVELRCASLTARFLTGCRLVLVHTQGTPATEDTSIRTEALKQKSGFNFSGSSGKHHNEVKVLRVTSNYSTTEGSPWPKR